MANIAFDYDLDGTNPDNLVPNEVQYVVPPTSITDTSVVVPRCAPFHGDSLVVNSGSITNPVPLTLNVDYFLVYKFIRASRSTGHQMFGGIMFTNRNFNGNIWLTYQTVGGDCVLDDYSIVEEWSRSLRNVRYISWDQLAGLPAGFPVADHVVGGDTLVKLDNVVDALNNVAAAITDANATEGGGGGSPAALNAHLNSLNAHTPASVGLGNLSNYALATTNDYNVGTVNAYANAAGVKTYVAAQLSTVNTNISNLEEDVEDLQQISSGLVSDVDDLQTQQTAMGNAISDLDTRVGDLETTQSDILDSVASNTGAIDDLNTDLGAVEATANAASALATANASDIAAVEDSVAALGAPFKLHGLFLRGSFLFTLLPDEQKDFTIIAPGGDGGAFATSPFEFKLVNPTGGPDNVAILNRLTNKTTGATLASGVLVAFLAGGRNGAYGYNDGSDNAGTGGMGGSVAIVSGEVETGSAATNGTNGTDGTTGDVAPVAGGSGFTLDSVTYGEGQDGAAKTGGGGSGSRAVFSVKNTTAFQLWYELQLAYDIGLTADQLGVCKVVHHDAP